MCVSVQSSKNNTHPVQLKKYFFYNRKSQHPIYLLETNFAMRNFSITNIFFPKLFLLRIGVAEGHVNKA